MKARELHRLNDLRNEVEIADGTVFYPGETEEQLREFNQKNRDAWKKKEAAQKKKYASFYKFIDAANYIDNPILLTDSIVDACCSQGCVCEPDGYCEHGNPSILLANGLI